MISMPNWRWTVLTHNSDLPSVDEKKRLAFPLKLLEDFPCRLLDKDLWSSTRTECHPTFLNCLTVNLVSYWKKKRKLILNLCTFYSLYRSGHGVLHNDLHSLRSMEVHILHFKSCTVKQFGGGWYMSSPQQLLWQLHRLFQFSLRAALRSWFLCHHLSCRWASRH